PLHRIERREVVEQRLVARLLGRLEVDRLDLQQREVPLGVLRWAHLTGDRVAGAQVEPPDLGRRHVNVVRAGEVIVVRRSQEAESVRKDLQHAFREDETIALRLALQDLEDQLLLAEPAEPLNTELLGHVVQVGDGLVLELRQIHPLASCPSVLRRTSFGGYSRPWNAPRVTLRDGRLRGMSCTRELLYGIFDRVTRSTLSSGSRVCHLLLRGPALRAPMVTSRERPLQPDIDDGALLDPPEPLLHAGVVLLPIQDLADLAPGANQRL